MRERCGKKLWLKINQKNVIIVGSSGLVSLSLYQKMAVIVQIVAVRMFQIIMIKLAPVQYADNCTLIIVLVERGQCIFSLGS